ncbi:MAG TPA: hypothetical protein VIL46_07590 [Gemmataceae bacterium]
MANARLIPMLIAAGAVAAAGCGGSDSLRPADAAAARDGLKAALDAWASGESAESLNRRPTPIYMADDDWHRGARLVGYEITGEGSALGVNHCLPVRLSLRDPKGKEIRKEVWYTVATSPVIAISREDRRRRGDS